MIQKFIIGFVALTVVMYIATWMLCRSAEKGDKANGIGSPAFDPLRDRIRTLRKTQGTPRP
jgi:hypothetical protein